MAASNQVPLLATKAGGNKRASSPLRGRSPNQQSNLSSLKASASTGQILIGANRAS